MSLRILMLLALVFTLSSCSDKAEDTSTTQTTGDVSAVDAAEIEMAETQRLNEWFAARWEEELDFSPLTRTSLGDKKDYDKFQNAKLRTAIACKSYV